MSLSFGKSFNEEDERLRWKRKSSRLPSTRTLGSPKPSVSWRGRESIVERFVRPITWLAFNSLVERRVWTRNIWSESKERHEQAEQGRSSLAIKFHEWERGTSLLNKGWKPGLEREFVPPRRKLRSEGTTRTKRCRVSNCCLFHVGPSLYVYTHTYSSTIELDALQSRRVRGKRLRNAVEHLQTSLHCSLSLSFSLARALRLVFIFLIPYGSRVHTFRNQKYLQI